MKPVIIIAIIGVAVIGIGIFSFTNFDANQVPTGLTDTITEQKESTYTSSPTVTTSNCDSSYPDVCIASYPPDLDCGEIGYSNFSVVGSDPHGFDADYDGIGCEVGSPEFSNPVVSSPSNPEEFAQNCDSSYPDVCIASYPPDLDCGEIGFSNFRVIQPDKHGFDADYDGIGCEVGSPQQSYPLQDCSGNARCIVGKVTQVIDGDTIKVDDQSIRFALAFAPELNEFGGDTAKEFIEEICPVGSIATVDEDDDQTEGSYGRIVGVIYCNGVNLNEELVNSSLGYLSTDLCDKSEFSSHAWTIKHGCVASPVSESTQECDESYPDVCIAVYPPDLDCGEIGYSNFKVIGDDPHGFDGDKDGIGCES